MADDVKLIHRGCCVRFDTLGPDGKVRPRIYEDQFHRAMGVSAVSVTASGDLQIDAHAWDAGAGVITAVASPDETLVARGISAGISGGGRVSLVSFYRRSTTGAMERVRADSTVLHGPGSNVWLYWLNFEFGEH